MEYFFSGAIDRIIFENASNFFKIILLEIEDTDSDFDDFEIIVTGTIADVIEGENYTFWGELTQHPKYGEQLKVTRYERTKPTSSGLIKYFSSDHFKGIGKRQLRKLSNSTAITRLIKSWKILVSLRVFLDSLKKIVIILLPN